MVEKVLEKVFMKAGEETFETFFFCVCVCFSWCFFGVLCFLLLCFVAGDIWNVCGWCFCW